MILHILQCIAVIPVGEQEEDNNKEEENNAGGQKIRIENLFIVDTAVVFLIYCPNGVLYAHDSGFLLAAFGAKVIFRQKV